jgi:hypothetical protein
MPTEIKVWEVTNDNPQLVSDNEEKALLEQDLEGWISKSVSILDDNLMVIDRQRNIEGVGRLDLLCLDRSGQFVIVELKRGMAPREAVAQALDYAAWLTSISFDSIKSFAAEYFSSIGEPQSLEDAASDFLDEGVEFEELNPQNHRLLVVAATLDSSAERIIDYLSRVHQVDINALFFRHVRLKSGARLLVRSVLVSEEVQRTRVKRRNQASENEVVQAAEQRGVSEMFEILRKVRTAWEEQAVNSGGGSFRYWAPLSSGKRRVVCGLNVAGERFGAPPNTLDVWIRFEASMELAKTSREGLLNQFKGFNILRQSKNRIWLRITGKDEAEKVYKTLASWIKANSAKA